jgi:membrane protease YdiL (CAAX protease family)
VGLRRPVRWLSTFGPAILFGVGYQLLDVLLITPLLERITGQSVDLSLFALIRGNLPLLFVSFLLSWTLAAFIEELFFRGYLLNRTMDFSGRHQKGCYCL